MNKCEEIEEKLHGYLDKELPQFDSQLVERHVEECPKCRQALNDFRKLKSEVRNMKFQEPSQSEWDQMRPPMEVKAVRGIGWILFAAGVAVLTVFGAYEFTVDPAVESIEKITVLAVVLGGAFLFVTVLYERIRSAKSDKYREIEK